MVFREIIEFIKSIILPSDDLNYTIKSSIGTFEVFKDTDATDKVDYPCPKVTDFVNDLQTMCAMIADGPLKSFCYRRLSYLYSKYQLHVLLNELRELASQKAVEWKQH